jgi:hypothetical protein
MAIKVSGTTVVNDSRELQNIATLDSTTTTTISSAVGGGASVQTFTSSGTWTKPSSGTVAMVTAIAGGGGGGNSYYYSPSAARGAMILTKWIPLSELASSVTVTIGAGGAGSTGFSDAGGNGGTTSFGDHVECIGGQGGAAQNNYFGPVTTNSGNSGFTGFSSNTKDSTEYISSAMVYPLNSLANGDYVFYPGNIIPSTPGAGTGATNPQREKSQYSAWCNVGLDAWWNTSNNLKIAKVDSTGYGAPGASERANTLTSGGVSTAQSGTNGFVSVVVF